MNIKRFLLVVPLLVSTLLTQQTYAQSDRPYEVTTEFPLDLVDNKALIESRKAIESDVSAQKAAENWRDTIHENVMKNTLNVKAKQKFQKDFERKEEEVKPTFIPEDKFPDPNPESKQASLKSPRNGKPMSQYSIRNLNVKIVAYQTPTQTVGWTELTSLISQLVQDLDDGSRYQAGFQALHYNVLSRTDVFALPPKVASGTYVNQVDIAQIYSNYNFCQQINEKTIDQVWIFTDGPSSVSPVEQQINGRTTKSYGLTNQPECGEAGPYFMFVYSNFGGGSWSPALRWQASHSYGHYVEDTMEFSRLDDKTTCDYVDGGGRSLSSPAYVTPTLSYCNSIGRPPSWKFGFSSHADASNNNIAVCGDIHYPPNAAVVGGGYQYNLTTSVNSMCNQWTWEFDPPGLIQSLSCSSWSTNCNDYNLSSALYNVWWMQRLPGHAAVLKGRGGVSREKAWSAIPFFKNFSTLPYQNDYNLDFQSDYATYNLNTGTFSVKYSNNGTVVNTTNACPTVNIQPRTGKNLSNPYYLVYEKATGQRHNASNAGCPIDSTSTAEYWGSAGFAYAAGNGGTSSDAWKYTSSSGNWFITYASGNTGPFLTGFTLRPSGPGYTATAADYDGDLILDPIEYNSTTGDWRIYKSTTGTVAVVTFASGCTCYFPIPSDLDGDHKAELVVYNQSSHIWYIEKYSRTGLAGTMNWGSAGWIPVNADYDGDGYANFALFDPVTANWYVRNRWNSSTTIQHGVPNQSIPISGKSW